MPVPARPVIKTWRGCPPSSPGLDGIPGSDRFRQVRFGQSCWFIEVNVLHPQRRKFHESQPRSVQQLRHQTILARHLGKNLFYFVDRQDRRQSLSPFRTNRVTEIAHFLAQYVAKQEQNGIECLILRRSRHFFFQSQIADEIFEIVCLKGGDSSLFSGLRAVVKETFYLVQVCSFRTLRIMLHPQQPRGLFE